MSALEGKVAFITGAGSGIGRGIAERLARDGAHVCIADVDLEGANETAALVQRLGRKTLVVQTNVASQPRVQEATRSCVDALGGLDIAVANAGIARGGTLVELALKDWQDQLDVNLTGVFLTAQAAAQRMLEQRRGGRIVCISSLAAENTGARSWGYSATKAGVRIMVRGWAQELGPHGITVNAIGPGVIETPLARMLAGSEGGPIRAALEQRTPAGRVGRPADVAGVVSFLCGPDADFMTGAYLLLDGGLRDARPPMRQDPNDPLVKEALSLMAESERHRRRLQPLIDER
jgi:NAD(P)-dependent dehydrogenase (short-subunit alcohol dehydrogenase family)